MQRILFANIGWMVRYQGQSLGDTISGGGSYRDDEKHEAFNFQDIKGMCYGYVQPVRWGSIKLSRIDPHVSNYNDKIDDVLVVWTARRPDNGGTYIVGWYKHATVYSNFQFCNFTERKRYDFNISAKYVDCTLLSVADRSFRIPRAQNGEVGGMGQSNVWYADSDISSIKEFREKVINYIFNKYSQPTRHKQLKVNVEARKLVETNAIKIVTEEFQRRGFSVKSVEKDNLGWDLEAIKGGYKLRLEVKGLAGAELSVRITQNEYSKMQSKDNANYRLCVVTNALDKPDLCVFIKEGNNWVCEDDNEMILCFDEQVAAIAFLK